MERPNKDHEGLQVITRDGEGTLEELEVYLEGEKVIYWAEVVFWDEKDNPTSIQYNETGPFYNLANP